jgi:hypothetical protein
LGKKAPAVSRGGASRRISKAIFPGTPQCEKLADLSSIPRGSSLTGPRAGSLGGAIATHRPKQLFRQSTNQRHCRTLAGGKVTGNWPSREELREAEAPSFFNLAFEVSNFQTSVAVLAMRPESSNHGSSSTLAA